MAEVCYTSSILPQIKRIVLPTSGTQRAVLHDSQAHHGFLRTFKRVCANFYWRMVKMVKAYMSHCPQCLRNNPMKHAPYAKIRLLTRLLYHSTL